MKVIAARHAVLPAGDGLRVGPARVHVVGARIHAVEPDAAPQPGDDDVGDLLLAPAFVDAHTHLALHVVRGLDVASAAAGNVVEDLFFRVERALTPDDIRAFSAVAAIEALLSGTAVVFDHYYAADQVLAACDAMGLAAVVAPALQDLAGPGLGGCDAALQLTERLAGDPSLAARGCGVVLGPHAPDTVSDGLWQEVAALAARWNLPVHTHVAQSISEVRRLHARSGRLPLAHLAALGVLDAGPGWRLVHGLWADRASVAALPASAELVACPTSSGTFGFVPPVARWSALGRRWSVGTDGAAGGDALDVRGELRAVAAQRVSGLGVEAFWEAGGLDAAVALEAERGTRRTGTQALSDPAQLLQRITSIPGSLHPAVPSGSLAAGQLAHLLLWDLSGPEAWPGDDPLRALAFGGRALAQVMVAGRWRGERGAFAASVCAEPRVREALAEASARRRALLARL